MIDLTGRKVNVNDTDYPVKYTGLIDDLQAASSLPVPPFGHKPSTTTGLTWGYYGGQMWVNGALTTIADGTLALTASATNYVEHDAAGVASKNTVAFSADKEPIAEIATGVASITTITDRRSGRDAILGGSDGYTLRKEAAGGIGRIWTPPMVTLTGGGLVNGKITETRAGNAITFHVKHWDGTDPSAADPIYVLFRDATAVSSQFYIRKITAALNVVVSSGSTLGHVSARDQHVFVYLMDVAGVVEPFVSNLPPDYPGTFGTARLISTTAEGGLGAADSATGVYSTTARANMPWVCVAKCISNQATAGTWVTALSQIDMAPFMLLRSAFRVYRLANQSINNATWTALLHDTETYDYDSAFDTASGKYQPNLAGLYSLSASVYFPSNVADGASIGLDISKNGSNTNLGMLITHGALSADSISTAASVLLNGTSDYSQVLCYHSHGSAVNVGGNASHLSWFSGLRS